jgi:hypothetical protein
MARLKDVMAAKKTGKLLTRDLLGKPCLIMEDITEAKEIRETEDGKYLCIQIQVDGIVKDWNPTMPQFKSVVEALGMPPNMKGKGFQVVSFVKDGYKSQTVAMELKGDYLPGQQRIDTPPAAVVPPAARPTLAAGGNELSVFLGTIAVQPGGHVTGDDALDQLALLICGGDATRANFLKGVAKSAGRIVNVGGCWEVVK